MNCLCYAVWSAPHLRCCPANIWLTPRYTQKATHHSLSVLHSEVTYASGSRIQHVVRVSCLRCGFVSSPRPPALHTFTNPLSPHGHPGTFVWRRSRASTLSCFDISGWLIATLKFVNDPLRRRCILRIAARPCPGLLPSWPIEPPANTTTAFSWH